MACCQTSLKCIKKVTGPVLVLLTNCFMHLVFCKITFVSFFLILFQNHFCFFFFILFQNHFCFFFLFFFKITFVSFCLFFAPAKLFCVRERTLVLYLKKNNKYELRLKSQVEKNSNTFRLKWKMWNITEMEIELKNDISTKMTFNDA